MVKIIRISLTYSNRSRDENTKNNSRVVAPAERPVFPAHANLEHILIPERNRLTYQTSEVYMLQWRPCQVGLSIADLVGQLRPRLDKR
jgi:hypothetical protein